ncbi:MAG: M10 family metallopeptidase C-terminal domain-containing protein, partial [Proteobacteria bacterium]|nr:M10 family metallopeptidase C-terminal domain-containing protein [Pseudomonadota bacterium]
GDDRIGGQDGDDFVLGGLGADVLNGEAGDDLMGGQEDDDFLLGGAGRDRLFGDAGDDIIGGQEDDDVIDGGSGRDRLFGDAGQDIIFGGVGADQLFGGAGADRFGFRSIADSAIGSGDIIGDFNLLEGDTIDLSAIDAISNTEADEVFTFVAQFTNEAGQAVLRYDAAANTTTLQLDVNGDGQADFGLAISGEVSSAEGWIL